MSQAAAKKLNRKKPGLVPATSSGSPLFPHDGSVIPAGKHAPALLLPYQQRWVKDQSPVKAWDKSRRIGASWTEAADDVIYASRARGDNVLYTSYNFDMTRQYIKDCAGWAKTYQKVVGAHSDIQECIYHDEDKDILAFRIDFASGNEILALSSRPTNIRSKQGRVVIDEAAFVEKNLRELLKAALALIMLGGQVRLLSTHNGEDNPWNELLTDIRAGKWPYSLHKTTFDDALADGYYRQVVCSRLGIQWTLEGERKYRDEIISYYGDAADEELFCIPAYGSGVYMSRFLVESCMQKTAPVIRKKFSKEFVDYPEKQRRETVDAWLDENIRPLLDRLSPNANHFFGEDFGRSGDLTVLAPLEEDPGLTYRCPFGIELRNAPFKTQEQIIFYLLDRLPRFRGAAFDARGNGQGVAEAARQRYGVGRVHEIMLSDKWYSENMPPFKSSFEERTVTWPADADWRDDICAFRMSRGVAKIPEDYKSKGHDGGQRHADAGVAAALGVYAIRNVEGGPIEYQSVIGRRFSMTGGARVRSFMNAPADEDARGGDFWRGI